MTATKGKKRRLASASKVERGTTHKKDVRQKQAQKVAKTAPPESSVIRTAGCLVTECMATCSGSFGTDEHLPVYTWSRSQHSFTCYAYCQGYLVSALPTHSTSCFSSNFIIVTCGGVSRTQILNPTPGGSQGLAKVPLCKPVVVRI